MKIKIKNFFKKLNYRYYIGIFVIGVLIVGGLIYILRAPKSAEAEWPPALRADPPELRSVRSGARLGEFNDS